MNYLAVLDKALEAIFGVGVVCFLAIITLSAFGVQIPLLCGIGSVIMMIIPRAAWAWGIRPDPFDNDSK